MIQQSLTVSGILLAHSALLAEPSHSEPSAADKETARALFKEANGLRQRGDFRAALTRYRAAHALGRTPVTALALGRAHESLGELLEAREVLLSIERITELPDESTKVKDARAQAKDLATQIAIRIPTLQLLLDPAASGISVQIRMDGEEMPSEALTLPRRLNPGTHVVSVIAKDSVKTKKVALAEGQALTLHASDLSSAEAEAVPGHSGVSGSSTSTPSLPAPIASQSRSETVATSEPALVSSSALPKPAQAIGDAATASETPETIGALVTKWGFLVGGGVLYTRFGESDNSMYNLEAALVVNHALVLGIGGGAIASAMHARSLEYQSYPLPMSFGYWGGIARYHFFSRQIVSFSVGTLVGVGNTHVDEERAYGEMVPKNDDTMLIVQPQLALYLRLAAWLRIAASVEYRFVVGDEATCAWTPPGETCKSNGIVSGAHVQAGMF